MTLVLAPSTGGAPPRGDPSQRQPNETSAPKAARPIGWGRNVGMSASAHLGLVAQSVGAIDPDVLCETFAFLIEFHVFRELSTVLSVRGEICGYVFAGY